MALIVVILLRYRLNPENMGGGGITLVFPTQLQDYGEDISASFNYNVTPQVGMHNINICQSM
jgi:hypothetical protein